MSNFYIETDRLYLAPLELAELRCFAEGPKEFRGAVYAGEKIEPWFRDIILAQADKIEADPKNWIWHTFWIIVTKKPNLIIGSMDFKNVPNKGKVEIGYGMGKPFEGNGYMTEAIGALCAYGLAQDGVSMITADTDSDNVKSQNVLKRCGFVCDGESDNLLHWHKLA